MCSHNWRLSKRVLLDWMYRKSMRYRPYRGMMRTCGRVCMSWQSSVDGSAISDCASCSAETALRSTARRPIGYHEKGLTVRRRKGRKRAVGERALAPLRALPNQRWSLDFVHDQMATGRRFRILNIVDGVIHAPSTKS